MSYGIGYQGLQICPRLPEDIDLAVVATPNKIVPAVMEDIGKKKIKGAIIVTAGFKEVMNRVQG